MNIKILFGTIMTLALFTTAYAQTLDKAKLDQFFDRLAEKNKAMGSLTVVKDGKVLYAPQLGWRDVSLREPLEDATGLPVQVENASNACALAHLWLVRRVGDSTPDFAYVNVSDGVGVGMVVNGQLVRGQGPTTARPSNAFGSTAMSSPTSTGIAPGSSGRRTGSCSLRSDSALCRTA